MDSFRLPGFPAIVLMVSLVGCGPGGPADDEVAPSQTPVPNTPPEVSVTWPASGETLLRNEWVTFTATVSDAETPAENLATVWRSDLDGKLGEAFPDAGGEVSIDVRFASSGEREITVTVTDEDGAEASTSFIVEVDSPPVAKIQGMDTDTPFEGFEVTFFGKVSDAEDDPRNLAIAWTDDHDRVLGTDPAARDGTVTLTTDALTSGTRTVTLTATDSAGFSASDTIKFTVQKCLDQDGDGSPGCTEDCDDLDPTVYPGAEELCDGKDQDCNGIIDNGWPDVDHDGIPDCRDTEDCDGIDNDGDGLVDEGFDMDEDGVTFCQGDCDDLDPTVYPGADDVCDGVDNDCDGVPDGYLDVYEPNETLETAYDLGDQDGDDPADPATLTLHAAIQTEDDVDWFHFVLEDDFAIGADQFYVTVRLSDIPEGADYDLYLWWDNPEEAGDPEEALVAESVSPGNQTEEVTVYGVSGPDSGGDFWVEVRAGGGFDCTAPYTLYIENAG